MKQELISIIIPTYNNAEFLPRALKSVINQTYKNIEILIINDGSTDDTIEIINKFEDYRIKLYNKTNGGVSLARNYGIKKANGKYLMFVDSDDWIEKDMVEICYNTLKLHNVKALKCNYYINYIENKNYNTGLIDKDYEGIVIKENLIEMIYKMLGGTISTAVWNFIIEKNIILENDIFFDKNLVASEDKMFLINILFKLPEIYVLNKPLYHYFINNDSTMHRHDKYEKYILNELNLNDILKRKFHFDEEIKLIDTISSYSIESMLFNIYIHNSLDEFYYIYNKFIISDNVKKILNNVDNKCLKYTIFKKKNIINKIKKNQFKKILFNYKCNKLIYNLINLLKKIKRKIKEL